MLAEHLRTGRRGRWISGPELAYRIQRYFADAEDVLAPLLVTPLLVLDEPTSNLDPRGRRELKALLRTIPATTVIATHDLTLMDQIEARRMILDSGRLDIYD